MDTLYICALGPDSPDLLTRAAEAALTGGMPVLLRTARHGVADMLRERGVAFETLDALYDTSEDFEELCGAACEKIIAFVRRHTPCVYGVSDPANDETVQALCAKRPEDVALHVLPGVTLADTALCAALKHRTVTRDARTLSALSLEEASLDPDAPLTVTEIDTRILAGEVKLFLMRVYPDELPVYFLPHAGRDVRRVPLCELDWQNDYGHTCALVVPPVRYEARERFVTDDLVKIMRRLRGFGGCPWDREQTHASLRPYLIEEACEACEAIDQGDTDKLYDELGDVLLQVVFHAVIGEEHAEFTLDDVVSAICRKMIERHEHVFGEKTLHTAAETGDHWERVKRLQRGEETVSAAIRDISRALPALMRAQKTVKKARAAGYDADTAARTQARQEQDEETRIGEALLALAGEAQQKGVDAEVALLSALRRYTQTFERWEEGEEKDE